ncbi:hypothetical protein [Rhodoblastus sp.]|uniref:hypothetical protein n=1 Tax=Rhodoblastus sp. TaxID=1962975 RepID=UPI003F9E9416
MSLPAPVDASAHGSARLRNCPSASMIFLTMAKSSNVERESFSRETGEGGPRSGSDEGVGTASILAAKPPAFVFNAECKRLPRRPHPALRATFSRKREKGARAGKFTQPA